MHFVSEEEEEGKFWRVFSLPPPKEEKEKNTINNTFCRTYKMISCRKMSSKAL
jgi:hypothetical protein